MVFLASVLLTAAVPAVSAAAQDTDLRNLSVVRFDFDNDVLLGKDNSFTAGWSLQWHSRLNDVWGPGYAKWIGRVPGLGDGGRGGGRSRAGPWESRRSFSPLGEIFIKLQKSGLVATWLGDPLLSGASADLADL